MMQCMFKVLKLRAIYFEESSRKCFVCGMSTESIRERLLSGAEFTFTKAVEIAQSLETAAEVAQELAVNDPDAGQSNVHRVATPTSGRTGKVACFCCCRRTKDVQRCLMFQVWQKQS